MLGKPVLALVSIGAVVGALATGVSQSSAAETVHFTSKPTTAALVSEKVVTPGDRATAGGTLATSTDENLAPKWAKGKGPESLVNATGGVGGNASASAAANTATPAAAPSFIGQQSSATTCSYFGHGCNPPDMAIAASPQFVLQGVNTQFEVWDTKGHVQPGFPVGAQQFFGIPNAATLPNGKNCDAAHNNQPFTSDPRALYDPADGRFWAAILQVEGAQAFGVALNCPYKSSYFIAVSQTGDPTGNWNVYEFNMETDITQADGSIQKFAADFTQIGINSQAIYFSGNMFGEQGGFFAEVFEANKAQMEAGLKNFTADGFFNLLGFGPGAPLSNPFFADTVQPVLNLDSSATAETFVDTMDGPDVNTGHLCGLTGGGFADSCSGLVVWTMSNPTGHDTGGSAPSFSGKLVATAPFIVNVPADQPSCNNCIDANDLRIPATPVLRNGVLYAAWGTSINAGNSRPRPDQGIEWAQVKLSDGTTTTGYLSSVDEALTYPAVMPDASGNVTMLFERMSHKVFPETRFIVKSASDANFSGPGVLLKAGESNYRPTLCGTKALPVCRWGDFEATSWDGDGHIWFAGQYANLFQGVTTPPVFGRNWGTWIGAIAAS
jgi:hypothetical protein